MNASTINPFKRIGALLLALAVAAPGLLSIFSVLSALAITNKTPDTPRLAVATGAEPGKEEGKGEKADARAAKKAQQRAEAIKKLCQAAGIGTGSAVADIGCGRGVDTVPFAEVVGPTGKVYAEEIAPDALTNAVQKVRALNLEQVVPILGQSEDPCLPPEALDLEYMHYVFHHFSHPRDMLHRLWLALKPGGLLVIIDREKGPPKVWVEDGTREKKHNWTGETTVVRLARESGFLFEKTIEEAWFEKEPFVLAFRKPATPLAAPHDPDPALPLKANAVKAFGLPKSKQARLAFFGLDQSRVLLPALRKKLGPKAAIYDVVLEEWATCTNEVPPTPPGVNPQVLRTADGKLPPAAGDLTFSAVIFADAYHRIWDPAKLLGQLHEKLPKDGLVVVLDRKGPDGEARRLAGHHRRIAPALVREDFARAGFELVSEPKPPAPDRFLYRFRVRGE
jgi:ubiquinone/menaquinone biosynthesis C-methylase UbiE